MGPSQDRRSRSLHPAGTHERQRLSPAATSRGRQWWWFSQQLPPSLMTSFTSGNQYTIAYSTSLNRRCQGVCPAAGRALDPTHPRHSAGMFHWTLSEGCRRCVALYQPYEQWRRVLCPINCGQRHARLCIEGMPFGAGVRIVESDASRFCDADAGQSARTLRRALYPFARVRGRTSSQGSGELAARPTQASGSGVWGSAPRWCRCLCRCRADVPGMPIGQN